MIYEYPYFGIPLYDLETEEIIIDLLGIDEIDLENNSINLNLNEISLEDNTINLYLQNIDLENLYSQIVRKLKKGLLLLLLD